MRARAVDARSAPEDTRPEIRAHVSGVGGGSNARFIGVSAVTGVIGLVMASEGGVS